MKRVELISKIRKASKRSQKQWVMVRSGADHEIWKCGETTTPIPRHVEIGEGLTMDIMHSLQEELGKGWWRK